MPHLSDLTLGFEDPSLFDGLPDHYRERYQRIYMDRRTLSLDELAAREGVTKQRIREIIALCESKLKREAERRKAGEARAAAEAQRQAVLRIAEMMEQDEIRDYPELLRAALKETP